MVAPGGMIWPWSRGSSDGAGSCFGVSATAAGLAARQASSRLAMRLSVSAEDRGGEQRRVDRAGLADRQRADRHAGRHLHDREQAVERP